MYKNARLVAESTIAAALLLGMLFLVGPLASSAYGAAACPADIAGTQAYAECVARESSGGAAGADATSQASELAADEALSSTSVWQLTLAGAAGLMIGIVALVGGRAAVQHRHAHAAP